MERFTKDKQGIIKDSKTNLEWLAGPDQDTDGYKAKAFVEQIINAILSIVLIGIVVGLIVWGIVWFFSREESQYSY